MSSPEINVGITCNIFARQMHFKNAGDFEIGHEHPYDHLTLLAKGRFIVEVDGVSTEFLAPHMLWVRADKIHKITSVTAGAVAYCIHGLRNSEVSDDIVAPDMVPRGVELRSMISRLKLTK
jgi:quercetin dioxygenase-like cupin family protein